MHTMNNERSNAGARGADLCCRGIGLGAAIVPSCCCSAAPTMIAEKLARARVAGGGARLSLDNVWYRKSKYRVRSTANFTRRSEELPLLPSPRATCTTILRRMAERGEAQAHHTRSRWFISVEVAATPSHARSALRFVAPVCPFHLCCLLCLSLCNVVQPWLYTHATRCSSSVHSPNATTNTAARSAASRTKRVKISLRHGANKRRHASTRKLHPFPTHRRRCALFRVRGRPFPPYAASRSLDRRSLSLSRSLHSACCACSWCRAVYSVLVGVSLSPSLSLFQELLPTRGQSTMLNDGGVGTPSSSWFSSASSYHLAMAADSANTAASTLGSLAGSELASSSLSSALSSSGKICLPAISVADHHHQQQSTSYHHLAHCKPFQRRHSPPSSVPSDFSMPNAMLSLSSAMSMISPSSASTADIKLRHKSAATMSSFSRVLSVEALDSYATVAAAAAAAATGLATTLHPTATLVVSTATPVPDSSFPSGSVTFVCQWEACFLEFSTHENLCSHVALDHVAKQKRTNRAERTSGYPCRWTDCPRGGLPFKGVYNLQHHIRYLHTKERPHACNITPCRSRFAQASDLREHLRLIHGRPALPPSRIRTPRLSPRRSSSSPNAASYSDPLSPESQHAALQSPPLYDSDHVQKPRASGARHNHSESSVIATATTTAATTTTINQSGCADCVSPNSWADRRESVASALPPLLLPTSNSSNDVALMEPYFIPAAAGTGPYAPSCAFYLRSPPPTTPALPPIQAPALQSYYVQQQWQCSSHESSSHASC